MRRPRRDGEHRAATASHAIAAAEIASLIAHGDELSDGSATDAIGAAVPGDAIEAPGIDAVDGGHGAGIGSATDAIGAAVPGDAIEPAGIDAVDGGHGAGIGSATSAIGAAVPSDAIEPAGIDAGHGTGIGIATAAIGAAVRIDAIGAAVRIDAIGAAVPSDAIEPTGIDAGYDAGLATAAIGAAAPSGAVGAAVRIDAIGAAVPSDAIEPTGIDAGYDAGSATNAIGAAVPSDAIEPAGIDAGHDAGIASAAIGAAVPSDAIEAAGRDGGYGPAAESAAAGHDGSEPVAVRVRSAGAVRTGMGARAWRAVRCAAVVVAVIAGGARGVRADGDGDAREAAREEFARGQAADKVRDWQSAIEHYLRANEMIPHPFAMFNIASDYERLHNLREAALWYQRYLAAAPTAPNRADVEKILASLKDRTATLAVRSIPVGAHVAIDGAPAGVTPLSTTIRGGHHRITVERDGQTESKEIDVEFAEPADVQVTLHGPSGTLDIQGTPVGAFVSVDGAPLGRVPAQIVVEPGQHNIHIAQYGYQPFDSLVTVKPGGTTPVAVAMSPGGIGTFPVKKLDLHYFFGAAGGADGRGNGAVIEGEIGIRGAQYEGLFRAGKVAGGTAVDLLVRWSWLHSAVSPYLGGGYAYGGSGVGFTAFFGVKWDFAERNKVGFTLRADVGVRSYTQTGDASEGTSTTVTALVPVTLIFEAMFR